MEIVFLIISICLGLFSIYLGAYAVNSKNTMDYLNKEYKENPELVFVHMALLLMNIMVWMTVLCALNNSFWELPYLFYN